MELALRTTRFDVYHNNLRDNNKLLKKSEAENATLVQRVTELDAELFLKKARIDELEEEVRRLSKVAREERQK